MNSNFKESPSLACDLTAIPSDVREEHVITAPQLFAQAREVQELADGFAIRFLNEPGRFMEIAAFIENDRLCCPFFNFGVDVEPDNGPLWLRLTGGEGVKEILLATLFDGDEEKTALKQSIQTGDDAHLDEVVAQMALPNLSGILKKDASA